MSTRQKNNFIFVAKYMNKLCLSENKEMVLVGLFFGFITKGLSPVHQSSYSLIFYLSEITLRSVRYYLPNFRKNTPGKK